MLDANDVWIRVHGSWIGWRSAEIRLTDLEDVHWCQPQGAPHSLVHGFVRCIHLQNGDIEHRCDGSTAHRIRVCVLKHHVIASTYRELAGRADARDVGAPVDRIGNTQAVTAVDRSRCSSERWPR
jgi:hypothetical protein